jgi:caffeoyl-CoA O-methyltransferase
MKFDDIQDYLTKITPSRPPVMREMEQYARRHHFPIIGPVVGRYLYLTAKLLKARRILELGSGFGYSAYWFSLAVGRQGTITLTDNDSQNLRRAEEYFTRARLKSKFDLRVGDALETAARVRGPFDIILNDIDKRAYPLTIDVAARMLRKGGMFITDNLIWSGRVLDKKPDKTTAAIKLFTSRLYADKRFFTTVLPLRDGVGVAIRL